jgi:hypothetical protein
MPPTERNSQNSLQRGAIEANNPEAQGRFLVAVNRAKRLDIEARKAWFVASTNEVDRKGTVILPSAFRAGLGSFGRHSPFLAAHMPWVEGGEPTQIGTIVELAIEADRVTIAVVYARTDNAEQWWRLASDPSQSVAVSVGFIPRGYVSGTAADLLGQFAELARPFADAGLADDDRLTVYTAVELLEVSQVAVPANSGAVQLSLDAVQRAVGLAACDDRDAALTDKGLRAIGGDGAALIDDAFIDRLAERTARRLAEQSMVIAGELVELKADGGSEQILEAIADLSDRLGNLEYILAGNPDLLERGGCGDEAADPDAAPAGESEGGQDDTRGRAAEREVRRDGAARLARACGKHH